MNGKRISSRAAEISNPKSKIANWTVPTATVQSVISDFGSERDGFAISWEKPANHRALLRSPGRGSQTTACRCDLLEHARKSSHATSIPRLILLHATVKAQP